jgi:hypothetical protein
MVAVPLSFDEIEQLQAAAGNVLRDGRAAEHFLARVNTTMRAYQAEVNRLHRQVSEISIRTAQTGAPSSLDPRDAVRFLPAGELAQLVEGHLRAQVNMLDRLTRDVTEQRQVAVAQVNRIKYLLVSLMEDPELDGRVRARLERIWKSLPPDEHLAVSAQDVTAQLRASFDSGAVWIGEDADSAGAAVAGDPRIDDAPGGHVGGDSLADLFAEPSDPAAAEAPR